VLCISSGNSVSSSFKIVRERGFAKWATYTRLRVPNRSPDISYGRRMGSTEEMV
jgi:hypothetical protein